MSVKTEATLEDLYHIPETGKAELVDGEIVVMSATGFLPGRAGGEIYASLRDYERLTRSGYAIPDNLGFVVDLPPRRNATIFVDGGERLEAIIADLPKRRSFSPDVSFFIGEPPSQPGRFLDGAPIFAVEIRSENDYGESAEKRMAMKRADYFDAGTQVVWDVDVLQGQWVKVYHASEPGVPRIYRRGDIADAEPVVPKWRMAVEDLFPPVYPSRFD